MTTPSPRSILVPAPRFKSRACFLSHGRDSQLGRELSPRDRSRVGDARIDKKGMQSIIISSELLASGKMSSRTMTQSDMLNGQWRDGDILRGVSILMWSQWRTKTVTPGDIYDMGPAVPFFSPPNTHKARQGIHRYTVVVGFT
jgi:hypothetical protein